MINANTALPIYDVREYLVLPPWLTDAEVNAYWLWALGIHFSATD